MKPIAVLLPARERFSPHGAGALAINACEFAVPSRFRNAITVYGPPVEKPFPDVRFRPLHNAAWLLKGAGYLNAFRKALAASPPALIEVWNRPSFVKRIRYWFPKVPIALHLGNDAREMRGARTADERRELLQAADRIFACTNWVREGFLEGLNGVSGQDRIITVFRAIPPAPSIVPKEKLCLFVGRLMPEKGALLFAQTMRRLLPGLPGWKACIVGAHRHGRDAENGYTGAVRREFAELGGQAEMMGHLPPEEVRALMRRASLVCVPSVWEEPTSRVAIEAMAEGALVATTGRGGLKEVVGDAALIINSEDPAVWAEQLRPWLEAPDRVAHASMNSRRQAKRFEPEIILGTIDREREALINSGSEMRSARGDAHVRAAW